MLLGPHHRIDQGTCLHLHRRHSGNFISILWDQSPDWKGLVSHDPSENNKYAHLVLKKHFLVLSILKINFHWQLKSSKETHLFKISYIYISLKYQSLLSLSINLFHSRGLRSMTANTIGSCMFCDILGCRRVWKQMQIGLQSYSRQNIKWMP